MRMPTNLSKRVNKVNQCSQLGGFPAQLSWFQYEVAGKFLSLRIAVFWATFCLKLRVFGLVFGQCSTGTSFLNMFQLRLDPFIFFLILKFKSLTLKKRNSNSLTLKKLNSNSSTLKKRNSNSNSLTLKKQNSNSLTLKKRNSNSKS